jgi:hypothetical protein
VTRQQCFWQGGCDINARSTLSPTAPWRDAAILIVSWPVARHSVTAAALRLDTLPQAASCLGWERTARDFIASEPPELQARCLFMPMPEIVSDKAWLTKLCADSGLPPPRGGQIVHLRFGSPRYARLLKNAENIMLPTEDDRRQLHGMTYHPLLDGQTLPHGFAATLWLGPAPRSRPLKRIGGGEIPALVCPPAPHATATGRAGALHAVSLLAYANANHVVWPPASIAPLLPGGEQLTLLLPWNFADPLSAIPDLILRLAALEGDAGEKLRLVLWPYNDAGDAAPIHGLRHYLYNAMPHINLAEKIWLAAVKPHSTALAIPGAIAWVNGSDPEAAAIAAQLDAAQIPLLYLGPPDNYLPSKKRRHILPDGTMWMKGEGQYGILHTEQPIFSSIALAAGIAASVDILRAAPKTGTKNRRPANDKKATS